QMNLERTPYPALALSTLRANLRATIARALLVVSVAAAPTMVSAASIVSASTPGQYNAGLGTLLDTSDPNGPFPCANIGCGDATVTFSAAPNLTAAAGALGNWLTTPNAPGG